MSDLVGNPEDRFSYNEANINHVFVLDGRGSRTRTNAATSPNIAIYVVSTYCATETTEIAQIKITDITYVAPKYVDLKT